MTDPSLRFRSELGVLRDHVVAALKEDNLSRLKDGLDLYERLVRALLERFRVLEEATGTTTTDLRNFYGQEMVWLQDDIRTFVGLAGRQPANDATHEVLGFVLRLAKAALNRRETAAFGSFLQYYRLAWEVAARELDEDQWSATREHLLLTLENLGDFWFARHLEKPAFATTGLSLFAERFLAELVQLGILSINQGREGDLVRVLHTLASTLRYSVQRATERFDDLEILSEATESDKEQAAIARSLHALKVAGTLSLDAWVIFRTEADKTEEAAGMRLVRTIREGPIASSWEGFLKARDSRTADLLSWSSWETSLWESRRSGSLGFHQTVDRTFAAHLIEGRARIPESAQGLDPSLQHTVRGLSELIVQLDQEDEGPKLPLIDSPEQGTAPALVSELRSLEDELSRAEDDLLIQLDLREDHVSEFEVAVVDAWLARDQVRALLSSERWEGTPDSGDGPSGFGMNTLVPKDYFVERRSIHADPRDLGREFGSGLARSEGTLFISALASQTTQVSTTLDGFASEVEIAIRELADLDLKPAVLVVNSWEMLDALRSLRTDGHDGWAAGGIDEAPRLPKTNTPVLLRYTEADAATCVVAAFDRAVTLRHKSAMSKEPGDRIVADERLLISVRSLNKERAEHLINANERFRQSPDGTPMTQEDAIRNLRKQVHVRVLEWLDVAVLDPTAARVIRLDEKAT